MIDLAYRIRENTHPDFGGLEVEIAGIEPGSGVREQGLVELNSPSASQ
jgi:hypothetical protein